MVMNAETHSIFTRKIRYQCSVYYEGYPESNETIFSHSQFILLKLQICNSATWIFGYLNLFFNVVSF
jgi:hypothetical protein